MATWTLSGDSAFPVFASKNLICQDAIDYGSFTASEMSALIDRVIDGDPESYWRGSTAVDGTEVTVGPFSFNLGSVVAGQTFDLIVLQNINWKNFVGEWSNDLASWTTITGLNYASGVADNAATDLIVNVAAGQSAKYVRFRVTHTITASQKKQCGGIIACLGKLQLSGGFLDYKVKMRESVRELELGDKSLSREYVMRSAADYEFWGASFDCPIVTTAELSTLRTIKRGGDPFVLIPEPADAPRDAYLCHFSAAWEHEYRSPVRSIGYMIPMKVREVGSH